MKSRGLGDSIKKITNTLGMKTCSKCKKRQKTLNRIVPYKFNMKSLINRMKKNG